ncbi:MAG: hypothetical protein CMJ46_15315 [Planctomyces sp.]|nr:hypothetical protein [Planctomyces sp.]
MSGDGKIQLKSETTIPVVEDYLNSIAASPLQNVQLPSKPIRSAGMGGESALIQFLLTWARNNPEGNVITPFQLGNAEGEAHSLKHLSSRAYSFVAMLAAGNVLAADSTTSIRMKTNHACSLRVDKMAKGLQKAAFGHRTFLACVDHSTKAFIPAFYFADGAIRNRSEFSDLAEDVLMSRAAAFTRDRIRPATRQGLGLLLYELIKNTHDWGRTGVDNVPLRPSIRGLLFTRLNIILKGALTSAGGNPSLEAYVTSLGRRSRDEYVRFLELSVFDSGPGLASRWLKTPLSDDVTTEQELAACFDCLTKHKTTSGASSRGLGLYDVMRTLNELKAFIRLRTGRLALFRDFISSPLNVEEKADGPTLYDWNSASPEPTRLAPSTGTLFTIVIPLLEERL